MMDQLKGKLGRLFTLNVLKSTHPKRFSLLRLQRLYPAKPQTR
jgi:hypothetical protein